MQLTNRSNRIKDMNYQNGWERVWHNISNPIASIEHEGWGNFMRMEILPFATGLESARYFPNYTLHLLGGGMSYRMMIEWYRYHGFDHPKAWSIGTMAIYHMLNEVTENSYGEGYTTDPVADVYFFDIVSKVLFSSDSVARFFGETLNLRDWSYMVSYDLSTHSLYNVGVSYSMKWRPSFWDRTSFFYSFGTYGQGGLSWKLDSGNSVSVSFGFRADELYELALGAKGATFKGAAGIFLDREGSLLGSLMVTTAKDHSIRLNLYPGLVKFGDWSPGFFVGLNTDDHWMTGINIAWPSWQPLGLVTTF